MSSTRASVSPHNISDLAFTSSLLSTALAPSLPPSCSLPQALHLCGLSACFFIWLVATGGSALADYNSPASHFRFIWALRAPTSLPRASLSPRSASIRTHTHTAICQTLLPFLSSSTSLPSSLFRLARKFSSRVRRQKEILCQGKRLSWRRQPWLCYYLGLCHHRWPQRVESIDRLSLKAFSRLHWQSLSRPLIARLAALAEAQEKSLTEPHYMVAFNQSPGPRSGLITVRK